MLVCPQPSSLVSDSPGKESVADTWVVKNTCRKCILVDLCLGCEWVSTARSPASITLDVKLGDVHLKAEMTESLDHIRDVLTSRGIVDAHMVLEADAIDRNVS